MAQERNAELTLSDADVRKCPFHTQDLIRGKGRVYRDPVSGFYLITHYGDVRQLAMDTEYLSVKTGILGVRETENSPIINERYRQRGCLPMDTLVTTDPPIHGFYRALVDRVFTAKQVRSMNEYLLALSCELIDTFAACGHVEFMEKLAVKLPIMVIADQLGISRSDLALFKKWSDAMIELIDPLLELDREIELTDLMIDMQSYFITQIERLRNAAEETLLSALVHADIDGRTLTNQELCSILQIILVAGNETTTNALGSAMVALIENPALAERLYEDAGLLPGFVDEVLRLWAPAQGVLRRAKTSFEIDGTVIPEGALVQLIVGAANRDPDIFPSPHEIDLDRPTRQAHLTFGAGRHFCIGSALVRSEMAILFGELLSRFKNFRYAPSENSVEYLTGYTYGPHRIMMDFDRR